jgi:hypothetical protein
VPRRKRILQQLSKFPCADDISIDNARNVAFEIKVELRPRPSEHALYINAEVVCCHVIIPPSAGLLRVFQLDKPLLSVRFECVSTRFLRY